MGEYNRSWLKPLDDEIKRVKAETEALRAESERIRKESTPIKAELKRLRERLAHKKAELEERKLGRIRMLCAAACQVVGAADGPVEMLDNLSAAASGLPLPHDPMAGLPWVHPSEL